ncbi:hypothetical protein L4174_020150 [Photobacterium sp. CCB-ST2H9]|uniref:hypothetical protein n=1 Tax=unclassified Photobacterium TaxID=2628852 RepID=UPI0020060532|nr:hypothetical protein [Photobacterium sp. CCB-ST2H9]UTM59030.1 hypothetical protein L4174_020150 [Photobacterium sp. CCB-ST2H9]
MIVNFMLYEDAVSWNSHLHQLTGDALRRHVQVKGKMAHRELDFSYCENSNTGNILNSENEIIGRFSVCV